MVDLAPTIVAAGCVLGMLMLVVAGLRMNGRQRMRARLEALGVRSSKPIAPAAARRGLRGYVRTLGAWVGARAPALLSRVAVAVDGAGLGASITAAELLGWKVVGVTIGLAIGIVSVLRYGSMGVAMLAVTMLVGWFLVDLGLGRSQSVRQRQIQRDLPTVMDLLVLSLEAGMGLDRALRTVSLEYQSPLCDELRRVLTDVELGVRRGEAFARMALRVGLDDLESLSRAIVQTDELGVSLVGVMQAQSRDLRISRRRFAEAEALRAPIKMLFPLVLFILPTLFMLLLGPVGLRAAAAIGGAQK